MVEALLTWRALRAAEENELFEDSAPPSPQTIAPRTLRRPVSKIFDESDIFVYPSPSSRRSNGGDVLMATASRQELVHPPVEPILSMATTADGEEPDTPPPEELDEQSVLDLEKLGLTDFVIPRGQLTKQDKIGEGGASIGADQLTHRLQIRLQGQAQGLPRRYR